MKYRYAIAGVFLAVAPFSFVSAQSINDRVDRLERMIEGLQEELIRTRQQLGDVVSEARKKDSEAGSVVRTDGEEITISTTGGGMSVKSSNGNSFSLGGRILLDYDFFDDVFTDNGESQSEGEFRRTRLTAGGSVKKDWKYKFTVNIDDQDESADVNTAYIEYAGYKPLSLKLGKFKESFSLERMVGSKWTSTIERNILLDFLAGNLGAGQPDLGGFQVSGFHEEMNNFNWALGIFDDGSEDADGSDNYAVTGRIAMSPHFGDKHFMHLGAAYSMRDIEGRVRYRSRLGVHTADGGRPTFADAWVDDVDQIGLELAYVNGPLSFQGEYIDVSADGDIPKELEELVDSNVDGTDDRVVDTAFATPDGTCDDGTVFVSCEDIDFDGYYLQASYILTGESRSYKTKGAYFDKVSPASSLGAWELVARYEDVDVDDEKGQTAGAEKWILGMNWYVNNNVKFMLNYISAEVDEALAQGDNDDDGDALSFRAQYAF